MSCVAAVLLGPLQSCTFLLNQGLLAATLGAFWSAQAHWAISVPAAALVRVTGTLGYIVLSSWTMNENLFALLLSNVYALLVSALLCPHSLCLLSSCAKRLIVTQPEAHKQYRLHTSPLLLESCTGGDCVYIYLPLAMRDTSTQQREAMHNEMGEHYRLPDSDLQDR